MCTQVAPGLQREYGKAIVSHIGANQSAGAPLLGDMPDNFQMWMSHGDKLHSVPTVGVLFCDSSTCVLFCDTLLTGLVCDTGPLLRAHSFSPDSRTTH